MRTFIAAGVFLLLGTDLRSAVADQGPNPNTDSRVSAPPTEGLARADEKTRKTLLGITVSTPAVNKMPLGDMLQFFADCFDIKFYVDEKAFKAAGIDDVLKKEVTHPKVRQAPFLFVLPDILRQLGGSFYVEGDEITIIPKRD
jgi:hypothetical protein